MIAIDEAKSTAKRLQLIVDNSDSVEEKFMAFILQDTIAKSVARFEAIAETPDFKKSAEEWLASMTTPEDTNGR